MKKRTAPSSYIAAHSDAARHTASIAAKWGASGGWEALRLPEVFFVDHANHTPGLATFMLFPSGKFDTLVQGLGQRISVRFPPVIANDPERTVPRKRIEEILDEIFAETLQPEREDRIGFLSKARLRNAFRRELREIGYEEKFVDFATGKLIEQLVRGAG